MLPAPEICESARLARDPRFDGRFIVAVVTTGIYCRPICPARTPAKVNVRYFATGAAAQDSGFRPCLRCRPELASALPEWTLKSETVIRGLRLISDGFVNTGSVSLLAKELGVSSRHLNRLFRDELGTSPKNIARNQRLVLAKRLISDTSMKLTDIAYASGYGSYRRFNDEIFRYYSCSPRDLKKKKYSGLPNDDKPVVLNLPVRQPYDPVWVFDFLEKRAVAPYEAVTGLSYQRMLGEKEFLKVEWHKSGLQVQIPIAYVRRAGELLSKVRRLFDLDADSQVIDDLLIRDAILKPYLEMGGGLRVPGAWTGFELSVRAILGQQVSVDRATKLVTTLVSHYSADGQFPVPEDIAGENPSHIGMPRQRGRAVQLIAQRVLDGSLKLSNASDVTEMRSSLVSIPGIGPWTAEYIAMRAGRDPDAFPEKDWVVLKRLSMNAKNSQLAAESWRPWRSYALMYLWRGLEKKTL